MRGSLDLKLMEKINEVRRAGGVKRYHTERTIFSDNIAQHTWNLVALIHVLHPNPSIELLEAATFHDVGESLVGGLPYTSKMRWEGLKEQMEKAELEVVASMGFLTEQQLTKTDTIWLKALDKVELILFAYEEIQLGNEHMVPVFWRGVHIVEEMAKSHSQFPQQILTVVVSLKYLISSTHIANQLVDLEQRITELESVGKGKEE